MHDPLNCAVHCDSLHPLPATPRLHHAPRSLAPLVKGALLTLATFGLFGCVGAWVDMPEEQVSKTAAHQQLIESARTPVITRTEKSSPERQWCGATLLVVILPIPLKLPVCESYGNAIAYGNDINGTEVPLQRSSRKISSDFHACGPFMFLGPLMHGYQGNALCGTFR